MSEVVAGSPKFAENFRSPTYNPTANLRLKPASMMSPGALNPNLGPKALLFGSLDP